MDPALTEHCSTIVEVVQRLSQEDHFNIIILAVSAPHDDLMMISP